ncbi:putative 2-aminoethylphosphonate ABC transporter ATP-binding protein [Hahella aquimaris]|uniref:putative 2-aminoethylphosphonate ABC transporter ATP-binding protein n=1 Tax=Hahella sp. HNIBRBA332 TaxID=3015983 RepID=UPI00273CC07F|nr:putative 2-aminoethylphosphonate ABC transporter ATP-binding protein [Hahella sp. HNIBRBA332]WLQ16466.1 putative 2-aminoethylphosphonate ABC transporter ATP-binding protein [Hahella sp. HNIBRBA332]
MSKSPTPYLQLTDIDQYFGNFQALKSVSLSVNEGEFVCFLGPSGCGKTSLLRIIAGLDVLSAGQVTQGGRDITHAPVKARDFGIVFQSYALFPNLSVADNVGYGLKSQGVKADERRQRVRELLSVVGLDGSEDKYPSQLSGGQQQRVALARALATSPGLLLLDEPLSALDARVRAHLRQEIKQLQARLGVTTIMVTHDQEEALTMADRIVVMNHGRIEQVGSPQDIYTHPRTPFVAEFVGEMNFLPGRVGPNHSLQAGPVTLQCARASDMSESAPVKIAVRPEDIRLRLNGDRHNVLSGSVLDIQFLGSRVRSRLALDSQNAVLVADISMNEMAELGLRQGQSVEFQLPRDRLRLFAEAS